jgi:hypothetical protein
MNHSTNRYAVEPVEQNEPEGEQEQNLEHERAEQLGEHVHGCLGYRSPASPRGLFAKYAACPHAAIAEHCANDRKPKIISSDVGFVCKDENDYVAPANRITDISPHTCREGNQRVSLRENGGRLRYRVPEREACRERDRLTRR